MLGIKVLSVSDKLSTALQAAKLSAVDAQALADKTVEILTNLRSPSVHDEFSQSVEAQRLTLGKSQPPQAPFIIITLIMIANCYLLLAPLVSPSYNLKSSPSSLNFFLVDCLLYCGRVIDYPGVHPPKNPRHTQAPIRFDANNGTGSELSHTTTSLMNYNDAIDRVVSGINSRFNQKGLEVYRNIETILINQSYHQTVLTTICSLYDIDLTLLESELFNIHLDIKFQCSNIIDFLTVFKANLLVNRTLYPLAYQLLGLVLVLPATNATSERSFSALKRLKTAMRNTMGQERMNSLILLHVHKTRTDALNVQEIISRFVGDLAHRKRDIAL